MRYRFNRRQRVWTIRLRDFFFLLKIGLLCVDSTGYRNYIRVGLVSLSKVGPPWLILKEVSGLKRGTCKSGPRGAAHAAKSLRWKYLIKARPDIEIILE